VKTGKAGHGSKPKRNGQKKEKLSIGPTLKAEERGGQEKTKKKRNPQNVEMRRLSVKSKKGF